MANAPFPNGNGFQDNDDNNRKPPSEQERKKSSALHIVDQGVWWIIDWVKIIINTLIIILKLWKCYRVVEEVTGITCQNNRSRDSLPWIIDKMQRSCGVGRSHINYGDCAENHWPEENEDVHDCNYEDF